MPCFKVGGWACTNESPEEEEPEAPIYSVSYSDTSSLLKFCPLDQPEPTNEDAATFGTRIREGAWAWSRSERNQHSNRRELRSLLFGLQAVA